MTRYAWLGLVVLTGCQSFSSGLPERPNLTKPQELTQAAPEGRDRAKLGSDQPDHLLGSATVFLDQGNDESAAELLRRYITLRPEHLQVRAQLGELLFLLGKLDESRVQFDLFVSQAQEHGEGAFRHLIHAHSRLVEIAEEHEDDYGQHLHRGIGLHLLACRRLQETDAAEEHSARSLFYRAAAELQAARDHHPDEARVHLYLYLTWRRLEEESAAHRALAAADQHALVSELTPYERRQLQAALLTETAVPLKHP